MSGSKQLAVQKSLYLKQFFTSYFERKHTLQTISSFTNGLTVIDCLIQQFEHSQNIIPPRRPQKLSPNPLTSTSQIQAQQKNISLVLENIYNRLSNIFENVRSQNQNFNLFSDRPQVTLENRVQDEQLYDILNKYKNDYKRQKEERIKADKQTKKLKETLQMHKFQKDKACEKVKSIERTVESLKKTNKELEQTILALKDQIQMLKQEKSESLGKIQEYLHLQVSFGQLNKQYELLILKYEQSQENQKLLAQKFRQLDSIVRTRIEENQGKWAKMVEEKLSQKDIFNNASCKAFKQLVQSFQKENRGINHKN